MTIVISHFLFVVGGMWLVLLPSRLPALGWQRLVQEDGVMYRLGLGLPGVTHAIMGRGAAADPADARPGGLSVRRDACGTGESVSLRLEADGCHVFAD